jgi:glutamine---fructose-6-phosphate transaminase (isomerizing)
MNPAIEKYTRFNLVKEMLETADIIRGMDIETIRNHTSILGSGPVFLTGEGSSRLLPAGKVRYDGLRYGYPQTITIEGAIQALDYDFSGTTVFAASNSGRTREVVMLLDALDQDSITGTFAVVGSADSPIGRKTDDSYVLASGPEKAVAATKTVVEQALYYDLLFRLKNGKELPDLNRIGDLFEETLLKVIPGEIADSLSDAGTIYWTGRTDGVAGELALKTNEITRKASDFLEGTYAVHGIEEIMDAKDVVITVDPFPGEEPKMREVLVKGVGLKVFSIGSGESGFAGITLPDVDPFSQYIQIAAGWNILVEAGLALDVDLDKPERARKVGNEYREA